MTLAWEGASSQASAFFIGRLSCPCVLTEYNGDDLFNLEWGQLMTVYEKLATHRAEILRIAARHGARNVRVFGSVARGEADERSDVDFLNALKDSPGFLCYDVAREGVPV